MIQTGDVKAANLYITNHEQEYGEFGLAQSKLWDAGTLCITIAANIAETAILGYPMCFPDSVVGFSAFPAESSEKFMHYIFTYIRNSIQNSVIGSIQDNINIDYLSQLDFKVPSRGYQDKIVGVLGTIDEKIDTNGRICTELEAVAQMLYNYWFTQFDFPNTDGKPYRSSGGEMVWNDQLKRKIPKGWEPGTINSILQIDNTTVDPRKMGKTIMEHYSIPAFDANHSPAYEPADMIESGKYMVSAECILTSKLNPHFKRLWIRIVTLKTQYALQNLLYIVPRKHGCVRSAMLCWTLRRSMHIWLEMPPLLQAVESVFSQMSVHRFFCRFRMKIQYICLWKPMDLLWTSKKLYIKKTVSSQSSVIGCSRCS